MGACAAVKNPRRAGLILRASAVCGLQRANYVFSQVEQQRTSALFAYAPPRRTPSLRAIAAPRNSALKMAAVVESAMRELHVYGTTAADNAEAPRKAAEPVKAVAEPGTPVAAEKASAQDTTAEKAKKQRRRRGTKKPTGKENIPPAGPVDVAALLKARAAAKKKGAKPVSAAAQAALANAKARPSQKKKAPKGRAVADPGCNGY